MFKKIRTSSNERKRGVETCKSIEDRAKIVGDTYKWAQG